jgi:hypothetical protein
VESSLQATLGEPVVSTDEETDHVGSVPKFFFEEEVRSPYLPIFSMFPEWETKVQQLNARDRELARAIFRYVEDSMGSRYRETLQQFSLGQVSLGNLAYLVKPGDVIVLPKPYPAAFMATSWLENLEPAKGILQAIPSKAGGSNDDAKGGSGNNTGPQQIRELQESGVPKPSDGKTGNPHPGFTLETWHWKLEKGQLSRPREVLELRIDPHAAGLLDTRSLEWYPLRYASEEVKSLLLKRGHTFWRCRQRQFVDYSSQAHELGDLESVS